MVSLQGDAEQSCAQGQPHVRPTQGGAGDLSQGGHRVWSSEHPHIQKYPVRSSRYRLSVCPGELLLTGCHSITSILHWQSRQNMMAKQQRAAVALLLSQTLAVDELYFLPLAVPGPREHITVLKPGIRVSRSGLGIFSFRACYCLNPFRNVWACSVLCTVI